MKKENTPIVVTSIVAGSVILIALLALLVIYPAVSVNSNTMTVQGTSTIKVLPDKVSVYFNIQTNGSTSSAANSANSDVYNQLQNSLVALGFNESQIGTQSYNIYPNYDYSSSKRTQNGYIATRSVKITMAANDTSKLASIIDAGVNAGAGISSINFELSTALQNQYKAQAIEAASKDAKTKADAVAAGFGKTTGKLVSVSVDNYNYYPMPLYSGSGEVASADSAKAAVANISPTQQDVTATVSATYKLA